jgi:hypothetical protein
MSETTTVPETRALARSEAADVELGSAQAALLPVLTVYLDEVATQTALRMGDVAGVAITLSMDGAPFTIGASSALARDVDRIQYQVGTGPCLHALTHGVGMYIPDLAADRRWGEYGPRAAARGALSCVSVPVIVDDRPKAVLKVYAAEVDGINARQQALAGTTAPEIAGGFALLDHLARQAQQLDGQARLLEGQGQLLGDRAAAMSTRRVIDVAIGVLMQKLNTDPDTAFSLLRKLSQNRNVKLHDVARELVESLPGAGESVKPAHFNERGQKPRRGR